MTATVQQELALACFRGPLAEHLVADIALGLLRRVERRVLGGGWIVVRSVTYPTHCGQIRHIAWCYLTASTARHSWPAFVSHQWME